jgi:hypothetical protein
MNIQLHSMNNRLRLRETASQPSRLAASADPLEWSSCKILRKAPAIEAKP